MSDLLEQRRWVITESRFERLKEAIVARNWARVEFEFDRTLSSFKRNAGLRTRPVDRMRPR